MQTGKVDAVARAQLEKQRVYAELLPVERCHLVVVSQVSPPAVLQGTDGPLPEVADLFQDRLVE